MSDMDCWLSYRSWGRVRGGLCSRQLFRYVGSFHYVHLLGPLSPPPAPIHPAGRFWRDSEWTNTRDVSVGKARSGTHHFRTHFSGDSCNTVRSRAGGQGRACGTMIRKKRRCRHQWALGTNQAVRMDEGPNQGVVVTVLSLNPKGCVQCFSLSRCLKSKIYNNKKFPEIVSVFRVNVAKIDNQRSGEDRNKWSASC